MFEATPNLAAYELKDTTGGGQYTDHAYIEHTFTSANPHIGLPITGSPPIITPHTDAAAGPASVATPFEALFTSFAALETSAGG